MPAPATHAYRAPANEPRHVYTDSKDSHPVPRQLPPIKDVIKGDHNNISITSLLSSTTAPSQQSSQHLATSPTTPVTRSYLDTPSKRSPEPFPPRASAYGPYESHERSTRPTYSPSTQNKPYGAPQAPVGPTNVLMQPPRTMTSPSLQARPGAGIMQSHVPSSPAVDPGRTFQHLVPRSPPPPVSSYAHKAFGPAYSYPPTTSAALSYASPAVPSGLWRNNNADIDRAEEIRRATAKDSPAPRQAYGESVKRHLDIFDIETSLNEVSLFSYRNSCCMSNADMTLTKIAEGSGHALDFARNYGTRAHQTQRSGPIPGSLPSIDECDDMIRQQQRVVESMARIRDLIHRQQQALAEQRIYDQQTLKTAPSEADEDAHSYMDKMEGAGGFAGSEAKKRRGRAAPPGRCHSCNRAETPEWRRGPDGARTLCNACGLRTLSGLCSLETMLLTLIWTDYAKLQRKMDSRDSGAGSSKLRNEKSAASSP